MHNQMKLAAAFALAAAATAPASAGEITGNGKFIEIHGNSACAYSGLNDTPEGDAETMDPGGRVQSFGAFKDDFGFPNARDLDPREPSPSPGWSCNPNRGGEFVP